MFIKVETLRKGINVSISVQSTYDRTNTHLLISKIILKIGTQTLT